MRYGSLFTGAGGLDLAVHALWPDAQLAWWSEVDEHASATFARHTDAPNLGDVTAIDWTEVEPVDVIVGGFPCQDLSHAGKRAGLGGDRSGLWFRMLDAMDTLRPAYALLENVAGIYTATGADDDVDLDRDPLDGRSARPPRAIDTVLGSLADSRWDAEWGDLRASDVGAPHQRRRWFAVAADRDHAGRGQHRGAVTVRPQHDPAQRTRHAPRHRGDLTLLPTPTVVDMGANKTPDEWDDWTGEMQAIHGNGNGHGRSLSIEARLLPTPTVSRGRNETLERDADSRINPGTTLLDVHHLARWGDYATAVARWEPIIGRSAPSPVDDQGDLSPAFVEWMMGWPDGWTAGSRSQRLKQCGNGVVPQQAAHAYRQLLARIGDPRG